MKALWKICLVVVVGVGGLAGQVVVMPPKGVKIERVHVNLYSHCLGSWGWRGADTAGYPITLDSNLINAKGEAWRAAISGGYTIMRPDGSFATFNTNGVFIRSGTWFTIEDFQIIDHPTQRGRGPSTVNIMYYNFQGDDGKMKTRQSYYIPNDSDFKFNIGVWPEKCYFRTKAPTK